MRLIKFRDREPDSPTPADHHRVGLLEGDEVVPLGSPDLGPSPLSRILHAEDPEKVIRDSRRVSIAPVPLAKVEVLPPLDHQEVWGAGVTYERSKVAREEESESAATFYDRVYTADRPELFFKATPNRVAGPGQPIRVRRDSRWSVPEPELALVLSPSLKLVGFTVGNDVSARDIEGENPLYLPQAKVYDGSCALGPVITLASAMPPRASIGIRLEIERGSEVVYRGETSLARMARTLEDLIDWLGREDRFPNGVILLTGTGIVPPDDFSLEAGDRVAIEIDGIGTLVNPVVRGAPA
ncbi:MAG: fumarylacetoacetate hydrolase family protein [Isosphaeraceae bacterium]